MTVGLGVENTMRYIPLAGLGLALWGLLTLDWFKMVSGALLFFGVFAVDLYKKRAVIGSGKLFSVYKPLHQLILVTRKAIETGNHSTEEPKTQLASALFFTGMIDAASQAAHLPDKEFLQLWSALFRDLDFDEPLRSRVLLFHQAAQTSHPAYAAIMKGGDVYTKFHNGNQMIVVLAGTFIEELVSSPEFPTSVEAL